jgi:hypothetical protein
LRIALRNVAEVVRTLVDHQCAAALQVGRGERVGRGDQFRRAVGSDLKRGQIPACGIAVVARRLEVTPGGVEITRWAASRRNRVRIALSDRVDMKPMEAWGQQVGSDRFDGHRGVPIRKIEGRVADSRSVGSLELGC